MLFDRRLRDGIQDGSISLAFRRWKRSQVVAGHRYRMGAGAGLALVTSVNLIDQSAISDSDARAAGFQTRAALFADLAGDDDLPIYRIELRAAGEPDPRDVLRERAVLTPDDLAVLNRRLDRISGAHATLEAIAANPGVRAGDLAPKLGWNELQPFKLHVRKLKELGLTISLLVGYELSPRGAAYLTAISSRRP